VVIEINKQIIKQMHITFCFVIIGPEQTLHLQPKNQKHKRVSNLCL
jgi:hypothetical protein